METNKTEFDDGDIKVEVVSDVVDNQAHFGWKFSVDFGGLDWKLWLLIVLAVANLLR